VVWTVHGVGTFPIHELAVTTMIPSPEEADPSQLVFGATQQVMSPQRGNQFLITVAKNRVEVVPLFPAGEVATTLFVADLPTTSISGEESHVSAFSDEIL
ncbi:uncharacterized protein METZ01_LOCUS167332, partial [marine metagenome]